MAVQDRAGWLATLNCWVGANNTIGHTEITRPIFACDDFVTRVLYAMSQ